MHSNSTIRWASALLVGFLLASWLVARLFSPLTGIWSGLLLLCAAIAYRHPRASLWAFLIYMPFGGTVVYTLGPHPLLHLFKDVFYLPALLALWRSAEWRGSLWYSLRPFLPALLPLLLSCLLTLVLVNAEPLWYGESVVRSLLIGAVGLKALLGYLPLLAIAAILLRDRRNLQQLMRLHVVLAAICCSLLLVQYRLLVTDICAGSRNLGEYALRYATLEARCFIGGSLLYNPDLNLIRLPGTFVAPWQWAWFLIAASFLTYATYASDRERRWRLGSAIAMLFVLASAVVSGQRVALALVPCVFAILILLTSRHRWRLLLELCLFSLLAGLLVNLLIDIQQPIVSFIDRWQASPPHRFILGQFRWTLHDKDTILGSGLGRATNAARWLGETKLVETYYAKLVYELGFFGMFAMLALVTLVTILTYRAYRSLRAPELRRLGLCLWIFIFFVSYNTFYYPLDVDPVAVYYWFFAGVLLRLPALQQQALPPPLPAASLHRASPQNPGVAEIPAAPRAQGLSCSQNVAGQGEVVTLRAPHDNPAPLEHSPCYSND